jgi:hypothetical protein
MNSGVRGRKCRGNQHGCQNKFFHTPVLTQRGTEPSGRSPNLLQFFFE